MNTVTVMIRRDKLQFDLEEFTDEFDEILEELEEKKGINRDDIEFQYENPLEKQGDVELLELAINIFSNGLFTSLVGNAIFFLIIKISERISKKRKEKQGEKTQAKINSEISVIYNKKEYLFDVTINEGNAIFKCNGSQVALVENIDDMKKHENMKDIDWKSILGYW